MTTRRTILKTGAILALAAGTAPTAAAHRVTRPDTEGLQAALDDLVAVGASGALTEVRDARWVWRGTSGVAELGRTRPVPVNGRIRAGSITKSFVATTVLQLVGEKRLALDDSLEQWLPGVIPGGDKITLHNLLQHTSGIVNYTNTRGFRTLYGGAEAVAALRYRTWTPQELVAFIEGLPPLFEPGASFTYSNTNYILLGLVIQRATGKHYATEIRRRILGPAGLATTQLPGTNPYVAGPHSHGYLPLDGGEPLDITTFNPSVCGAAGELVTTTSDLNRFYRALVTGRLLRPAELAQMRTVWTTDYGLGLQTRLVPNGTRLWGHEGSIFGAETSSWSAEDGSRQVSVAYHPWGEGNPQPLIDNLLAAAFSR